VYCGAVRFRFFFLFSSDGVEPAGLRKAKAYVFFSRVQIAQAFGFNRTRTSLSKHAGIQTYMLVSLKLMSVVVSPPLLVLTPRYSDFILEYN
jgi:hypothetical protein